MNEMSKYDKNFEIVTQIDKQGLRFYDTLSAPFVIDGVFLGEEGNFVRMPQSVANTVSAGVAHQNRHTVGGRVRFKTDSARVAISTRQFGVMFGEHVPATATAGFDLYEKVDGAYRYFRTFLPKFEVREKSGYESLVEFPDNRERELLINFPLGSGVTGLYIGLEETASLEAPVPYRRERPIVYYGSSITKGYCASRPGNTYQNFLLRHFDWDYVNLGFSGCAKGEPEIARYVASLDMAVFVYDYDHNADDVEQLRRTHKPMFDLVRKAHPEVPVIMLSRPTVQEREDFEPRFQVIKATYDAAVAAGDENVYLIDGRTIMPGIADDSGTVDSTHPNDLGFYCMAKAIGDVLETILKRGEGRWRQ